MFNPIINDEIAGFGDSEGLTKALNVPKLETFRPNITVRPDMLAWLQVVNSLFFSDISIPDMLIQCVADHINTEYDVDSEDGAQVECLLKILSALRYNS